ncbi:MAG: AMP-binding protein [Alphaproteobacteria bacterium]
MTVESGTLQFVVRSVAARGEAPALIAVGEEATLTWSYDQLWDQAARLAGGLKELGVEPGEPVALFAPNRPEWVLARLALLAVGALAVPVDDLLAGSHLTHVLADSGCRRIFTTRAQLATLQGTDGAERLEPILLDDGGPGPEGARHWRSLLREAPESLPEPGPEEPAALFYTSGTTGAPKGVPLTHRNIMSNLETLLAGRFIAPAERVLLPLPLHHSYPFLAGMLLPLAAGATIVLPADVTGPEIVRALREGQVRAVVGVPRLYEAMLAGVEAKLKARGRPALVLFRALLTFSMALRRYARLRAGRLLFHRLHEELGPELKLLACGGARLEPEVERALEGLGFEILNGYGLVETASISTFNPRGRTRVGSVGLPAPGGEVRVAAAREGQPGEVWLRGPNVFKGYRNDPAANRAAFTEDGWFRTGDLGRLDADGYLYVTGRANEMIVLPGGKNLAPEDVEAVYAESPYIREVAVLKKDGALMALVVPELEAIRDAGTGRIDDLIRVTLAELSRRLRPYQRVSGYALTRETLPRTRLGKYQRHELLGVYERAAKGEGRPPEAPLTELDRALFKSPRARRVWAWVETRFPNKRLTLDVSPQLDLGVDSLAWVSLSLEMEERTGVKLSEEALASVMTLRDLLRAAEAAGEGEAAPAGAPVERDWLAPPGPGLRAFGFALYLLNRALIRGLFGLKVEGLDRLPEPDGPLLLASNHTSDLDTFAVAAALPWRQTRRIHWGGDAQRMFSGRSRRLVARAARVFPVDDRTPGASLAVGVEVLRRGKLLVWFPEEWRSPDGRLQPFLPGVGRLVKETGAVAVPAVIRGTFEALPRGRRLPRLRPLRIIFGAPLEPQALEASGRGQSAEAKIAHALQAAVASLAGEGGGGGLRDFD